MYDDYNVEEIDYKKCKIKIKQDESPENPRDWDNFGQMICFHGRYDLGDKTDLKSDDFDGWEDLEDYLIKKKDAKIILPLYMYDHSGIRIKVGSFYGLLPQGHAEFDSGQIGFIYATAKEIKENFSAKRITKKLLKKAEELLKESVEIYDAYARGQVYGFVAEGEDGEEIDSCWGFYDVEEAIDEAKDAIDYYLKEKREKHVNKLKAQIKAGAPLTARQALN